MAIMTHAVAEQTIRSLGLILSNSNVYGPQHSVTHNATDACFQHLSQLWQTAEVCINLSEDDLTVNNVSVEQKNPLIKAFVEHLEARSISNFTLKPVMTRPQLEAFIEILLAKPDELQQLGELSGAIAAVGLGDAVATRKVTYMEVTEDEVVVEKDALNKTNQADSEAAVLEKQLQEATDLLRGTVSHEEPQAADSLRNLSNDTDQLSDVIIASATSHAGTHETMAKEIIACLNRLYLTMTKDPTFHTQKTKKQIHKMLTVLEETLVEKLQRAEGNTKALPEDIQAIKDTIETMEDELTIDTLSQEYVKRRSAIGASEKRILRFMKNKSVDTIEESDLKSRLIEGGLSQEDWSDLLDKSGASSKTNIEQQATAISDAGTSVSNNAGNAFNTLHDLLKKVESDAGMPDDAHGLPTKDTPDAEAVSGKRAVMLRVPEEILTQDLEAVQQEVNRIILQAEKSIEKLIQEIEGPKTDPKNRQKTPQLSQKRLFEILAELGQELCQPLAVINCTTDTLLSGMLGELTKVQNDMLKLSAESSQKLKGLIDKIIEIAGVPDALCVDKDIQTSLYQ